SEARLFETGGVNRVRRHIRDGFRSIMLEPRVVETLSVRLRRADKMPAVVPDFGPGMIAAQVAPHRRARQPRGNAYGATRVHQQNGQAGAARQTIFHAFARTLVGSLARRGIM